MSLYRIVYVSECRIPVEDPASFTAEIAEILATARAQNAHHGVTGALLVSPGYFAQVLEGPPAAVKSTFGHIACDPRNAAARLLDCGPIETPAFAAWSMAFVDATGLRDLPLLADSAEPPTATAEALLDLLRQHVIAPAPAET